MRVKPKQVNVYIVSILSLVCSQSIQTQFKLRHTESEMRFDLDPLQYEVHIEQQFHTQALTYQFYSYWYNDAPAERGHYTQLEFRKDGFYI
jgi:hypothetical protein